MDGNAEVIGAYAWAHEMSSGKDTPSGHWEIAGVPVLFEWGYFSDHENSFPQELLINWSNALICRVTSVTATLPVRSFWINWAKST